FARLLLVPAGRGRVVSGVRDLALGLPEEELRAFVLPQRWFGSKSADVAHVQALDAFPVRDGEAPLLAMAVVETRFQTGTHELYNLPLGFRPDWSEAVVAEVDGWSAYDALADLELVRELVALMRTQETIELEAGRLQFSTLGGGDGLPAVERFR